MSRKFGIIVLDTLRKDTFSEIMENVVDLSVHSYEAMYSTSRWTPPAHASLFTGYYPTEVGINHRQQYLTTPVPVLAEQFNQAGYRTIGLSENINIDSFFRFDRGFDRFVRGPNIENRPRTTTTTFDWKELEKKISNSRLRRPFEAAYHIFRSDEPTIQTLRTGFQIYRSTGTPTQDIEWATPFFDKVSESREDHFLFANFMTPHYPYNPPSRYSPVEPLFISPLELSVRDEPVTEEEHYRHFLNYEGAARYLDDVLPPLIQQIDWDLLFVISDHGELFGEYGLRGHHYGMYEELVHVPCVAYGGLVDNGVTTSLTSIVDVHRTMVEQISGEVPEHHRGMNLLSEPFPDDRAVYAESSGCEWYSPDAKGVESLIPAEWNDPHYMVRRGDSIFLSDKDGNRVIDLGSEKIHLDRTTDFQMVASNIRESLRNYSGNAPDKPVPDRVQSQLEYLGYR